MEVHDNALKHETHQFMKGLAHFLDEAAVAKAYDRLILALTPKALGILRPLLSNQVSIRITAELDKDITYLSKKQLYDYLDKILWV